ncbi:MAG: histidinol-phosphatase, partial [Selenomonas sp.]|nr:histidinol-phosphatase [Selenomonas sp.]
MRFDYHMHLEYGSYDEDYAEGFFRAAEQRGVYEIGFSEHSHT